MVPLLWCNWALVVVAPQRASSSRSGPISHLPFVCGCPYSALCCYGRIAQNASGKNLRHFVSARRSGDFGRAKKKKTRTGKTGWVGGVGAVRICRVKKNVWECKGSTSASKTEVTVRSCCKKQFEKKKTLPKALKFPDCRERIRRQIKPSYKKKP